MKYALTSESIKVGKHTLYRIVALKNFSDVKQGDLGGYVASILNPSQTGNCRIHGSTRVFGKARILGTANVFGEAIVQDNAVILGKAWLYAKDHVRGNERVSTDKGNHVQTY